MHGFNSASVTAASLPLPSRRPYHNLTSVSPPATVPVYLLPLSLFFASVPATTLLFSLSSAVVPIYPLPLCLFPVSVSATSLLLSLPLCHRPCLSLTALLPLPAPFVPPSPLSQPCHHLCPSLASLSPSRHFPSPLPHLSLCSASARMTPRINRRVTRLSSLAASRGRVKLEIYCVYESAPASMVVSEGARAVCGGREARGIFCASVGSGGAGLSRKECVTSGKEGDEGVWGMMWCSVLVSIKASRVCRGCMKVPVVPLVAIP